jgi:hypothetical protein
MMEGLMRLGSVGSQPELAAQLAAAVVFVEAHFEFEVVVEESVLDDEVAVQDDAEDETAAVVVQQDAVMQESDTPLVVVVGGMLVLDGHVFAYTAVVQWFAVEE